jgi:hypothetical protein
MPLCITALPLLCPHDRPDQCNLSLACQLAFFGWLLYQPLSPFRDFACWLGRLPDAALKRVILTNPALPRRVIIRVGQNRIPAPYMTVCMVISLPRYRIYTVHTYKCMVLANPSHNTTKCCSNPAWQNTVFMRGVIPKVR